MKRLLFVIALLLFVGPAMAASVTLAWDASPTPGVSGYAIFDRNYQKPYNYTTPSWTGPSLTGNVTVPDDRVSAFVARAFVYGPYDLAGVRTITWSDNSNEVTWTPTVVKPDPPRNLIVRILVAIGKFFGRLFG
jgi:hypothetical protein